MSEFVPPWVRYADVAASVREGDFEAALNHPSLSWLDRDLQGLVQSYLSGDPGFDGGEVRFLDAVSGVKPDDSLPEARIFQMWSSYPQISAMLESTGLPKVMLVERIRGLLNTPPLE